MGNKQAPEPNLDGPVRYPNIDVQLIGQDSNGFNLIGLVRREMKRAGVGEAERNQFSNEAMSGDYDHLLQTFMKWVNVT